MSRGLEFVKQKEQYREYAYPDPESDLARAVRARGIKARWGFIPALDILEVLPDDLRLLNGSPWTAGYGETKGVSPTTRWSEPVAFEKLKTRYKEFETAVLEACQLMPTANQLSAMTSLAYNIGLGWRGPKKPTGAKDGFRQSTVLKAHNRGEFLAASRAFGLWNKANGAENRGLTIRRGEEGSMYLLPDEPEQEQQEVTSRVEPESKLTESPINKANVLAGTTATIAMGTEIANAVSKMKESVDNLGDWLIPGLLIFVVMLCAYTIYMRNKQRKEGWA